VNIHFTNARILTMKADCEIFVGEIYTFNSTILYVGEVGEDGSSSFVCPADYKVDRTIDCEGNVLMPGFKNAHAHSGMSILRSNADDMPLGDWLNIQIFPLEAKLTPEMIYWATKLSVLEYLTSGITAAFDMYLTPESMALAYKEMGFRGVICGNMNNFSSSLADIDRLYNELNSYDPLISYRVGYHAEYTTSPELMAGLSEIANKYKEPVYVHASETEGEVAGCVERYGMTPIAYMDSLGLFNYGGGLFHAVHVTDEDIAVMKKRGLFVVTNPGSNTKLASGIAPISKYLEEGVNLAIGTDGPASNNCLDMFREMFLVTGLAKLREKDAAVVDAREVLRMATVGSAHAMCLNDCDVLETGKQADIIMIDLHQPNMQPINNITKNIVYSGSKSNVKMTMIAGKILYENGTFASDINMDEIYSRANEIIASIK